MSCSSWRIPFSQVNMFELRLCSSFPYARFQHPLPPPIASINDICNQLLPHIPNHCKSKQDKPDIKTYKTNEASYILATPALPHPRSKVTAPGCIVAGPREGRWAPERFAITCHRKLKIESIRSFVKSSENPACEELNSYKVCRHPAAAGGKVHCCQPVKIDQ